MPPMNNNVMAPLPMRSRRVRLRPPTPQFIEELYELGVTNQIPWIWPGTETPEGFHQSLWDGVSNNYAIEDLRNGRSVGMLMSYNLNPFHGFCYVAMVLHPDFRYRVWPLEGTLLFANYLFIKYNLQNIYAESAAPYFEQIKSGAAQGTFEVEGRLRDRVVINGERHDLYILTIKRDRWLQDGVPAVERITRDLTQRSRKGNITTSRELASLYGPPGGQSALSI